MRAASRGLTVPSPVTSQASRWLASNWRRPTTCCKIQLASSALTAPFRPPVFDGSMEQLKVPASVNAYAPSSSVKLVIWPMAVRRTATSGTGASLL
jgi:hypothetical protein